MYNPDDLRERYRKRLETIDPTEIPIQRLGMYARMNSMHYNVFVEELMDAYRAAGEVNDRKKQMSYIYLVNEIAQKDNPDNIETFKPVIEEMMELAAKTKDSAHITRAKHVLDVLSDRKVLDPQYVLRVKEDMDMYERSGPDEETNNIGSLKKLNDRLVRIKQDKLKFMEEGMGNEDDRRQLDEAEMNVREELLEFYAKNLHDQTQKINNLKKILTKNSGKDPLLDGSDDDDDSDLGLL